MRGIDMKRISNGRKRIGAQQLISDVQRGPAFLNQRGITAGIVCNALLGEMLPPITFQCDAKCRQCKVNRVATDLVLKDVGNSQYEKCLLGHRLDVGTVAILPLLAEGAGLETVPHTQQGGATVGTTALTFGGPISFYGKWLAAESTNQIHAMGSAYALAGTEVRLGTSTRNDAEYLTALFTSCLGIAGLDATFAGAVIIPGGLGDANGEHLPAFGAGLGYLIVETRPRTVHTVGSRTRDEWLTASMAENGNTRGVTTRP